MSSQKAHLFSTINPLIETLINMDFGHFSVSWVTNCYNIIVNPTNFISAWPSSCGRLIKISASLNYTTFTSLAFGFPESLLLCTCIFLPIKQVSLHDILSETWLDKDTWIIRMIWVFLWCPCILSRFHCIIYLAYSSWVSFSVQIIKASTSSLPKASSHSSVGKSSSTFRLGRLK